MLYRISRADCMLQALTVCCAGAEECRCFSSVAPLLQLHTTAHRRQLSRVLYILLIECLYRAAADLGHIEVAQLLVNQHADVSAAAAMGFRPLHLAVRAQNGRVAQILLTAGADPTVKVERLLVHNLTESTRSAL